MQVSVANTTPPDANCKQWRKAVACLVWITILLFAPPCFGNNSNIQLSPGEQAWIDKHHTVRVRIGNAPPFMMTQGKIQGIAIDYLEYVFNRNKIKYRYVSENDVTWPQALEYIRQHEVVDLVPTAKITDERKKHMLFTHEYIFAPWVIFTRSDADFLASMEDLKGKTVAVEEGFVIHEKLKREYPEIKLKVVPATLKNYAEIPLRDLSTGLVDAYIGNLYMTTYMIHSGGYTNVMVAAPTPFENHNQAMALRDDWPELAGIINKTIAAMAPEEHAAIRNKWLVVRYEYGINKADVARWMLVIVGVASVFLAFVLFWNRRLKREVAVRKRIEKDLRDRETLLNDVGAIAKIGGWEMDMVTRKAKWTRGTYDIVEIEMGESIPGLDEHINYYLPPYRDRVSEAMAALIHEDRPLDFEAPLMTARGNTRWCRAMGRAIRKDGKCIKLYGTFQDITERKTSEEERKKHESLFEKIFDILPVGLWITDEKGKLLRGNPAGVKIWGAEPHVDPSNYGIFKARRLPSGEDVAPGDWALVHTVTKGITVVDEMLEINAFDGKKKTILNFTAPVFDEGGKVQAAIVVNLDITELRRVEAIARQSETRHRTLIDTIPDLIWLKDTHGVYLSCNPTFERFFGATESEIIGKTDYDFVDETLGNFFRDHDRKAMEAGRPSTNEEWLTFADNGYRGLFETIKAPMFDTDGNLVGVLGIARDITERKKTEDLLKENEQRYKKAQIMGRVGNWEYDLATERFWGSDETKRIYGFDPKSKKFTTEEVESCIPERDRVHQALVDLIEKDMPYNLEFEIRPVSGPDKKTIKSVAEVIKDESGRPLKVVGVVQDITEEKEAEKAMARVESQLRQSQKMESIGILAGGIAHDFNNILSSVIGYTELALEDVEKGTLMEDSLQEVYAAGKRARDLVKQILAFARQADEEVKPIRLDTIAEEVLRMVRSTIPTTIEIRQQIESHSLVKANPSQIHQIFLNLCTNAAQAMDHSGGILEFAMKDVALENEPSSLPVDLKPCDYLKVTVTDTGSGIPPDIIDAIFEPYFTTKGVGEGTGMGLAITHGIVESYGGKITVQSQSGSGSSFTVYLPITKSRNQDRPYKKDILPSGTERILLVDDELPIAKMGGQALERLGYQVTTCASSVAALELFHAKPDDFDLILTDMTMPHMTGDELAMKCITLRPDIPVILWTGYNKNISDETATMLGIRAFVHKPLDNAELAKTVRKVLDAPPVRHSRRDT